jgi:hypothetical protein
MVASDTVSWPMSIYSYDLIEVILKDQTCVKMARFFDFPRKMRRFVSMGWVEKACFDRRRSSGF